MGVPFLFESIFYLSLLPKSNRLIFESFLFLTLGWYFSCSFNYSLSFPLPVVHQAVDKLDPLFSSLNCQHPLWHKKGERNQEKESNNNLQFFFFFDLYLHVSQEQWANPLNGTSIKCSDFFPHFYRYFCPKESTLKRCFLSTFLNDQSIAKAEFSSCF